MDERLMAELKATGDPRATGSDDAFESLRAPENKKRQKQERKTE
jgi:hypothetical protein